MIIAIINDNKKKLKMWSEFIPEAKGYSHPSLLFFEKVKNPDIHYDLLVLDRMFHGQDILDNKTLSTFRETFPGVILVLSSALHVENEKVLGVDFVIDQWPVDSFKLRKILRK